jgi:Probable zinc-ribbon domain
MSGKRRHNEREARKRASERQVKLDALAHGFGVNRARLAPHGMYIEPDFVVRGCYVDESFVCQQCGAPEVWTAAQQKWWYEVAKGNVFSTARLCRPCRQRERAQREQARLRGGDPNPYKNPGLLLAKVRSDIEPKLLSAGYRLVQGQP